MFDNLLGIQASRVGIQSTDHGGPSQQWQLVVDFPFDHRVPVLRFTNRLSGKVLSVIREAAAVTQQSSISPFHVHKWTLFEDPHLTLCEVDNRP